MRRDRVYCWALAFSNQSGAYPKVYDEWEPIFPPIEISRQAEDGLEFAAQLAINALQRQHAALDGKPVERLTMRHIADETGVSPGYVSNAIKRARIESFGRNLSDSAIYYRRRHRRGLEYRTCAQDNCRHQIPPEAPTNRLYCDLHRSPKARTRRHRFIRAVDAWNR